MPRCRRRVSVARLRGGQALKNVKNVFFKFNVFYVRRLAARPPPGFTGEGLQEPSCSAAVPSLGHRAAGEQLQETICSVAVLPLGHRSNTQEYRNTKQETETLNKETETLNKGTNTLNKKTATIHEENEHC